MHCMRQDMDLGIAPGHQLAVHPDPAVTIVVGTRHSLLRIWFIIAQVRAAPDIMLRKIGILANSRDLESQQA